MIDKRLKTAPRTILICCMRLIGDVILATPLIGLLKGAYPEAQIDFLVNRKTGEFLERDPRVRRVIYNERFDVGANRHAKGKAYLGKILGRYDMAINLNPSDRGTLAVLAAGRRYRIGFYEGYRKKDFWKKLVLTHPLLDPAARHRACLCATVAQSLGIQADLLACHVHWGEDEQRVVAENLRQKQVSGKYLVIHPFTRGAQKNWRMEHFASVSDSLARKYALTPVWTSSPAAEEVRLIQGASALCSIKPVVIAGEFSLNQMACLVAGAQLYLGLDTAITHIAAAQGVPLVALYGPSPNIFWFPWSNDRPVSEQDLLPSGTRRVGNNVVVQKDWDCVPCHQVVCKDGRQESLCLTELTPQEVLDAVDDLLGPAPL